MAVRQYDEFEVRRAQALKAWRSAIRLKHSLKADDEIAQTLPQVEAAINVALLTGEPLAIDAATAFRENV